VEYNKSSLIQIKTYRLDTRSPLQQHLIWRRNPSPQRFLPPIKGQTPPPLGVAMYRRPLEVGYAWKTREGSCISRLNSYQTPTGLEWDTKLKHRTHVSYSFECRHSFVSSECSGNEPTVASASRYCKYWSRLGRCFKLLYCV
jgi:hypothetical protein